MNGSSTFCFPGFSRESGVRARAPVDSERRARHRAGGGRRDVDGSDDCRPRVLVPRAKQLGASRKHGQRHHADGCGHRRSKRVRPTSLSGSVREGQAIRERRADSTTHEGPRIHGPKAGRVNVGKFTPSAFIASRKEGKSAGFEGANDEHRRHDRCSSDAQGAPP